MCDIIYKIKVIFLIIIAALLLPGIHLQAQVNTEVKAIQLFDKGNYQAAEELFRQLLEQTPNDPVSQYYYGAARTENKHYTETELEYLLAAGKDITPDRLNYYLGVQYHARESWEQALKYYNLFRISVPLEEQKEVDLAKKIQLCFNRENPYTGKANESGNGRPVTEQVQQPVITGNENPEHKEVNEDPAYPDDFTADNTSGIPGASGLFVPREALPNLPNVETILPEEDPVDFQVNNIITYQYTFQFQTEKGRQLFEHAQDLKLEQENTLKEVNKLRDTYKTSQTNEIKNAIASKILDLENKLYRLEEEKLTAYQESRVAENEYWDNAGPVSRNNFLIEQEKILEALNTEGTKTQEPEEDLLIDFIEPEPEVKKKSNTTDLNYKIQIGAYSKGVPAYRQRLYNKLSVIRTIENYTDEKGVVVYTTGNLSRFEDAVKMQAQVKQEGIEDAKVVPYFKGKRITLEQAKEIEAQNDI